MTRSFLLVLLVLLVASFAGGCHKKGKADCAQVSKKVVDMIRSETTKGDPKQLELAQANLPTLQSALAATCQNNHWGDAVRDCIMQSKSASQLTACDPALMDAKPPEEADPPASDPTNKGSDSQ